MDLEGVRGLAPAEIAEALDALGVQPGWLIGDDCREGAPLPEPKSSPMAGFQNVIVGTIAERAFRDDHLSELELDFEIVDYVLEGENRDFGVERDGLELPINVKVASTLFRNARRVVDLDPEDCVPISAYKAIGASERVPDLVYVDLVDFSMRERVDDFVGALDGEYGIGYHLFSWYGGRGTKRAQDEYVTALFDRYSDDLKALAPGVTSFRVISAQRVLAILRENPRRVPGLGVPGAGTGGFIAEVNVHISVEDETVPWELVSERLQREGIQPVLDDIRRTAAVTVPDPEV